MMKYFLLITIALLSACNQKAKSVSHVDPTSDTLAYYFDSVKTVSKVSKDTSIHSSAEALIVYPVFSDKEISKMIEKKICDNIYVERKGGDYKAVNQIFINDYENFVKEDFGSDADWYMDINQEVVFNSSEIISVLSTYSAFSGGAHPNTAFISYNINPKKHTFLTIDSLIKPGRINDLNIIAERIFRQDEKLSETESLKENYFFENDKFKLTETFNVTHQGLMFTYSPYEIKAYVYGDTKLVIPINLIRNLLRPQFAGLFDPEKKL